MSHYSSLRPKFDPFSICCLEKSRQKGKEVEIWTLVSTSLVFAGIFSVFISLSLRLYEKGIIEYTAYTLSLLFPL